MSSNQQSAGRIFVAAPLADDVRRSIGSHLQTALGNQRLPGRAVSPLNWHITLRFLGDTTSAELRRVCIGLAQAELGRAFDLLFTTLGAFPAPDRARVLWLGTGSGAAQMGTLAQRIETVARAAGFEPERRPFRAHLTLARLKPEGDVSPLLEAVPSFDTRAQIDEVVVFRSHLGPGGPRYEAVERYALAPSDGPARRPASPTRRK